MVMLAQATPTPTRSPILAQPILGEQSLLIVILSTFPLTGFGLVLVMLVVLRNPQVVAEVVSTGALHLMTVMLVLLATVSLAVEGIISGEAAVGVLGGIVGYVLGSLKEHQGPAGRQELQHPAGAAEPTGATDAARPETPDEPQDLAKGKL